ncbi:MAG: DUF6962 family protein [Candidatus Kariarchaeaceae archaeon]|jgi:hypothetical protein
MVEITEPMTMITDYILGVMSIIFTIFLFYEWSDNEQLSVLFWTVGFLFMGIGGFAGGTRHGFTNSLSERNLQIAWKSTTYSIGIATLFILIGSIISSIDPGFLQYLFLTISGLGFIIYVIWMRTHNEFIYVIMLYVPSMLLIIILKIISYFSWDDPSSSWLIAGIILAFIGAGIQASKFALHKHMNHNDIFHIIQMVSTILLYKGALLVQDLPLDD